MADNMNICLFILSLKYFLLNIIVDSNAQHREKYKKNGDGAYETR